MHINNIIRGFTPDIGSEASASPQSCEAEASLPNINILPLSLALKSTYILLAISLSYPIKAEQITKLEDIVVSSQRREELLQQVPITVNSFNADFLTTIGAQSLADLENFSPALEVDNDSTTQPRFKIRGIGTTDFGIGTDPAVSIYQDNVYIGRSGNALLQFTDIERVEVLKGPQGALFGRNSAAGVIHVITKQPNNELSGSLRTRFGNDDKRLVEAVVNTPLIDNQLLLRVNGIFNQRDGFVDNADGGKDFSDEDYQAARANLLWHITEATRLNYVFEFNHVDQQGPTAIGLHSTLSPSPGNLSGPISNDVISSQEKRYFFAHSLNFEHQFSFATMRSISSYRQFNTHNREDEDGIGKKFAYLDSDNIEGNQQFSQEIRFNGISKHFDWITGLNYAYEKGDQETKISTYSNAINALFLGSLPLAPSPANTPLPDNLIWNESMKNKLSAQSFSAFADINWAINEQLKLTYGIRYTHDKKSFSWKNLSNNILPANADLFFPASSYPLSQKNRWLDSKKSWDDISSRAVISYQWNDQLMTFFTYSQGYKAGGFNTQQLLSSFEPETVENFEGGIKSSWFNQKLLFNASIFHYLYENKQDISFEQQGGLGQFITRTGNAKAHGGELELRWLPVDNLQLGANYGYLDANWTKRTVNAVNYNTSSSQLIDLAGQALTTPRHHASVTLDYELALQQFSSLAFHIDHSYTSKRQFTPADADYYFNYKNRDAAHHYTNLRMSWHDRKKHWQVAVWGENVFDNTYSSHVIPVSALALGTPYVRPDKPALWGIELIVDF